MRRALALATVTFAVTAAGPVAAGTLSRPALAAANHGQPLLLAQNDSNDKLFALYQQLQQIQQQLRGLQGQVDTLKYQIKQNEQSQRALYQNLDRRLSALEKGQGGGNGTPQVFGDFSGNKQGAGGQAGNGSTGGPNSVVQSAYMKGFNLLKNGKYDGAISAFKQFVSKYPQTSLTDNAWYWLGEAYYVKQNYSASTQAFETVVNRFKNSSKIPDSLYKIGLIDADQGQMDNAKATLHRITQQYPHSNAAQLAQKKLQSMGP
jgi:tol-pal system protein YbgF